MPFDLIHTCRCFQLSHGSGLGKNVIIFGADMSSSVHNNNKKKDIIILHKGSTDSFDDTVLTGEVYFTEQQNNFFLSLHFYGVNFYQ